MKALTDNKIWRWDIEAVYYESYIIASGLLEIYRWQKNSQKNEYTFCLRCRISTHLTIPFTMVPIVEFSWSIVFEIQVIVISTIILVYFAWKSSIQFKRQHDSWLALLIMNFLQLIFDLLITLTYCYPETLLPQSNALCIWRVWLSFFLYHCCFASNGKDFNRTASLHHSLALFTMTDLYA